MMVVGKCPKCEKTVHELKLEPVNAREPFKTGAWYAVLLECPHCSTVLGAQLDPLEMHKEVMKALKGR